MKLQNFRMKCGQNIMNPLQPSSPVVDLLPSTLPGTNMEVENHLFVVKNGLPRGHAPLPC